jgi:hypothetical protein
VNVRQRGKNIAGYRKEKKKKKKEEEKEKEEGINEGEKIKLLMYVLFF